MTWIRAATPSTDEQILDGSLREPELFALLVERHGKALFDYLTRRIGDAAEDVHSEMWLVAFRRRKTFDPELGQVRGWLFGIARTLLVAQRREAAKWHSDARSQLHDGREDDGGWCEVDDRLVAAALAPEIHRALNQLPESEREIVLLMAWEGLTPTEAAQVLAIPAGTARSRLHRARASVREHLLPAPPLDNSSPKRKTEMTA